MHFLQELLKENFNPVAKHAHKVNKAARMKDKKKAEKRGDQKHKKKDHHEAE